MIGYEITVMAKVTRSGTHINVNRYLLHFTPKQFIGNHMKHAYILHMPTFSMRVQIEYQWLTLGLDLIKSSSPVSNCFPAGEAGLGLTQGAVPDSGGSFPRGDGSPQQSVAPKGTDLSSARDLLVRNRDLRLDIGLWYSANQVDFLQTM